MENEVMNVEVMENENNEVVENEIVPVEATHDEPSESDMSKRDMAIGGVVLTLAAAGAVALGRGLYKGTKAIVKKIKDRSAKKGIVDVPPTAPIDEQPVEVVLDTEEDEVINETE